MKKLPILIAIVCFCFYSTAHSFTSPLIFKTEVMLAADKNQVLIADVNTSKFNRIKVTVKTDFLSNVRPDYVSLSMIEGKDFTGEFYSFSFSKEEKEFIKIIEMPSSNLRISAIGRGKLKVFVWGSN